METNKYLERYMKTQNALDESKEFVSALICDKYGVTISPRHFNYFYFEVKANGCKLNIEELMEVANWILEVTDGLEETHGIMGEIRKRK